MLLTGTNFGGAEYSNGARVGNTASEATAWVAETTMSLKMASGACVAHNAVSLSRHLEALSFFSCTTLKPGCE